MAIEGIIFSDLFIADKETFIKIFTQYYQDNQKEIEPIINNLHKVLTDYGTKNITEKMSADFKLAWTQFQKKVLLNEHELELLVGYREVPGGRSAGFSAIVNQSEVEGSGKTSYGNVYGIKAGDDLLKESAQILKAQKAERFLQQHLNNFLDFLDNSINAYQAYQIHRWHEQDLIESLQNTDIHVTNLLWRQAFYSYDTKSEKQKSSDKYYYGGRGLGKAYDAFMNHMADKERAIFDFLKSGGVDNHKNFDSIFSRGKNTVYVEEKGIDANGNFSTLLRESRNSTGWYTGGDIVIVSPETMQIVYNIQLKTTRIDKPSIFLERVAKIQEFLDSFTKTPVEQKAEKLFNFLLTSISNASEFNNIPTETMRNLVEENLKIKGIISKI